MSDRISDWKKAKELCESISHLSKDKQIEFIQNSNISESIQQKALNLIQKLTKDFDLIESGNIDSVLPDFQQKFDLSGKIIGEYELIKLLGSGGMSSVYLAKRIHTDIQKYVALKILSPYATADKRLELFNREQKSLSQLNHNNIISLHHGGQTDDGTNYLVMDYVENGVDIVQYCQNNNLEQREKIELVRQIAQAISYAHNKNIIHRDLKSANILIDANNEIKIVDFGIARFAEENNSDNSTRVFTYDIASPEQIQGEKVDYRTDIFSLGALLLQILTGKTPTPDVKLSKYNPKKKKKHISQILKTSGLNADLKNIIHNATHIDLNKRYVSMEVFAQDLNNFLNHQPVIASKDSFFYRFKKFLQRNPLTSLLTTSIIVVSIVAAWMIYNNIQQRHIAEDKTSRSMALIDSLFQQADPFASGKNSKDLVATLQTIESNQQQLLQSDPEFSYHFYHNMANIYNQNANYHESLKAKQKSITALEKYKESDDETLIENQIEVLSLLHATGSYEEAITNSQELLSFLETHDELKPVLKLKVYIPLSRCYASLNQLDEELKIHKLALEHMDLYPEIDSGFKADLLGSMAISQYRNGNKSMTAELFDKTIETYKSLPGRKKNLAATLRNYAAVNVNYGNFDKAEQLFEESINIIKSVDPTHPTLASTYMRYSSLLAKTQRLDKAEELLHIAIKNLTDANDNVELPIAYTYLAELLLRKNNIETAAENIINAIYNNQNELDHPKTLKIYNLALWILLLEPYQNQAEQLLSFMEKTDFTKSITSKEYQIYQVQKAFVLHQSVSNEQSISVLTQYMFGENRENQTEKVSWLEQQISKSSEYDEIVKTFLNVWLIQLQFDKNLYEENCRNTEKWHDDAALFLKFELMNDCSKLAKNNDLVLPEDIQKIWNDMQKQLEDITTTEKILKALVKQLDGK